MPAMLPEAWPAQSPVQVLPSVYVTLPSLGTMAVASWSIERELSGSLLPGSVRAASGISIGSGSVTVSAVGSVADRVTPWSKVASRRVEVGGDADLFLSYDGPDASSPLRLGSWQVDPASGSLISPNVQADLVEKQYSGRVQSNLLPVYGIGPVLDPIWMIDRLARQIGYRSATKRAPSAWFYASLQGYVTDHTDAGADWSVAQVVINGAPATQHDVVFRRVGNLFGMSIANVGDLVLFTQFKSDPSLDDSLTATTAYVTASMIGTNRFTFGYPTTPLAAGNVWGQVEARPGNVFAVRATESASWVTGTYVVPADETQPDRLQIEVQRVGSTGAWTAFKARARTSTGAWSSWITSSVLSSVNPDSNFTVQPMTTSSIVSDVQVATADAAEVWEVPNASLDLLGGTITAPYLPADLDVWTAIQQIAASWCAAAWVTSDGKLIVRNRDYLSGAGIDGTPIDIGTNAEDLPWTLDPADFADRLELTYAPSPGVQNTDPAPIAWEASDVIAVPGGQTMTVVAELEQYTGLNNGSNWWDATNSTDLSAFSQLPYFCTSSTVDGKSPVPGVLHVSSTMPTTGRLIITLTNASASTVYLADGNGSPALVYRAWIAPQTSTAMVERGASVDEAISPLQIDAGKYVQNLPDAISIADYIWGRVSNPTWKASGVRVALDWTLDIGDIVRLQHSRTGLDIKAIITKVAYDGSPGEVKQTIDLVLLPPTWTDFDAAWAGKTWTGFDAAWAGKTWTDFDNDPLRTEA